MKTFNYASTSAIKENITYLILGVAPVSSTHLRAHET